MAAADERRRRRARWLDDGRHVRPAIDGDDLLAAGLSGPAVGAGLARRHAPRCSTARAPDREAQLAAALHAAG